MPSVRRLEIEPAAEPNWASVAHDLNAFGCATIKSLLPAAACRELAAMYVDDARFRSRVIMARHGFGRGEYKYFAYPLPALIAELRTVLYPPLATVANEWNALLKSDIRFPPAHAAFLRRCHDAGQTRPTPLLLK